MLPRMCWWPDRSTTCTTGGRSTEKLYMLRIGPTGVTVSSTAEPMRSGTLMVFTFLCIVRLPWMGATHAMPSSSSARYARICAEPPPSE